MYYATYCVHSSPRDNPEGQIESIKTTEVQNTVYSDMMYINGSLHAIVDTSGDISTVNGAKQTNV